MKRYELSGKENVYAIINLFTSYLAIDLTESIDESILLRAVKEAIKYHPLFGTKFIFENGLFYFEENPEPPVIFRDDNAPEIYGNSVSNNYPWIFVIKDKRLILYTIHALTDGTGMFRFTKTVLHLYYEKLGIEFKDTTTDFPQCTPEQTMENPIEKYADPNCIMLGTPKFDLPVKIDPNLLQLHTNNPWRLVVPYQEIRKFAKGSETSVFAVISCFLSRAMAKAYDINSGNIFVRVPVSFRNTFPSETDRNFVQGFSLCYLADRMNTMSDAKIETAFRSQLDIWTEEGNLTHVLNEDVNTVNRLKANFEKEIQSITDFNQPEDLRANILYTHITRPEFSEELMTKIDDMHLAANIIQEDYVSVFGITVRSDICLTIQQCSKDDCYIDALREVLDEREITYKMYRMELESKRSCRHTSDLINYK